MSFGQSYPPRHRITRRIVLAGLAACAAAPAFAAKPLAELRAAGAAAFDHSAFDALLSRHVRPDGAGYNRVDYRGMKGGLAQLEAYVGALSDADPVALSPDEAHAYWINLYNAVTLLVVTRAYPVSSIKDIDLGGGGLFGGGPWSKPMVRVRGLDLSLDDIEHRVVRPLFDDPLSHYALNCASRSCPNLSPAAYTGKNRQQLMAEVARAYVNHPRGVAVAGGRITASRIYSWYADDFGGKAALKDHWLRFAEPAHGAQIASAAIGRFVYDWSLNDAA